MVEPYYDDGQVTIYHGDALDILPTLPIFDLAFADPPYNVGYLYDEHDDNMPADEYEAWCQQWFDLLRARARRLFVTCGYVNMAQWAARKPSGVGAWHKPGNPKGAGIFQFCEWEPIFVWGTGRIGGSDVFRATVGTQRDVGVHTCPKPLSLLRQVLLRGKGETVIDPFMGSGTTLRAAKDLGMRAVGIERSEAYCAAAVARMGQGALDLGGAA